VPKSLFNIRGTIHNKQAHAGFDYIAAFCSHPALHELISEPSISQLPSILCCWFGTLGRGAWEYDGNHMVVLKVAYLTRSCNCVARCRETEYFGKGRYHRRRWQVPCRRQWWGRPGGVGLRRKRLCRTQCAGWLAAKENEQWLIFQVLYLHHSWLTELRHSEISNSISNLLDST
jgi:hypothetical protein